MYIWEMLDFGECDKIMKIIEKWINQTLTTGSVVISTFPLIFMLHIYIYIYIYIYVCVCVYIKSVRETDRQTVTDR